MDMIWYELRSNNIEIDRETLSFHIDACLREHEDIYGAFINQLDKDNLPTNLPNSLCDIYEEMFSNNFGRLIAYLTLLTEVKAWLLTWTLKFPIFQRFITKVNQTCLTYL